MLFSEYVFDKREVRQIGKLYYVISNSLLEVFIYSRFFVISFVSLEF